MSSSSEEVQKSWQKMVYMIKVLDKTREPPMARLIMTHGPTDRDQVLQTMHDQASTGSHRSGHRWPVVLQLRVDRGPAGPVFGLVFLELTAQIPDGRAAVQQTAALRLVTGVTHGGWALEARGAIAAWPSGLKLLRRFARGNVTPSGSSTLIVPLHNDVVAAAITALVGEADRIEELLTEILTGK